MSRSRLVKIISSLSALGLCLLTVACESSQSSKTTRSEQVESNARKGTTEGGKTDESAGQSADPGGKSDQAGEKAAATADAKPAEDGKEDEVARKPLPLQFCTAKSADVKRTVVIPGVVSALPDHSVKVGPAVAGKLTAVYVVPGQHIMPNQLVARLDDRHIRDQMEQANVAVQTAKSAIMQAENNVNFAKDNLDRTRKLFTAEVAAKKDIVTAENQVQTAEAQLLAVKAQVKSAQTNTKQFETELSFTQVHSPLEGVVANRYLNVGDTADLNTPIAQIVQLQTVLVNASLPADSPERLRVGQHAQIKSVAHADVVYDGVITSISPVVDAISNSIRVQLECRNKANELREGQAVNVSILSSTDKNKILVPTSALVPDPENPDKEMVYVVNQGKASRVAVTKGAFEGANVEILDGLKPGQTIVAQGAYGLPNDSPVEAAGKK